MDPVLFDFGFIQIRWYSLILLLAFLVGSFFIFKEGKKLNIDKDYLFNMIFWTILFSLIGARIYYVIFNFSQYQNDLMEIFKVWHGGLAIHGGIIAGVATILVYTHKYNVNVMKILDIFAPALLIGQAIGRWGNFFNSEAHGAATSLAVLKNLHLPNFIIEGMQINTVYYHPTFLYESIWCLIGFIVLLIVRRYKYLKNGQVTALYLIWYGLGRFFIEISRTDSLMLGNFKIAQLVSIAFILLGIGLFIYKQKKTNHFEDLYNEKLTNKIQF